MNVKTVLCHATASNVQKYVNISRTSITGSRNLYPSEFKSFRVLKIIYLYLFKNNSFIPVNHFFFHNLVAITK